LVIRRSSEIYLITVLFSPSKSSKEHFRHLLFGFLLKCGLLRFLRCYNVVNNNLYVLTFHRVTDEDCPLWPPMKIGVFEKLIDYLSENAVVVLPTFFSSPRFSSSSKPYVVITFDDGYHDFIENVLPIMSKYSMPCIHHICPRLIEYSLLPWPQIVSIYMKKYFGRALRLPDDSCIDIPVVLSEAFFLHVLSLLYKFPWYTLNQWVSRLRDSIDTRAAPRLMSWSDILFCVDNDITFGSHSLEHENLSSLSYHMALECMTTSRLLIEDRIGRNICYFAFPSGQLPSSCRDLLRRAGYAMGFSSHQAPFVFSSSNSFVDSLIPRVNMGCRGVYEEMFRLHGFHSRLSAT